jgi:hypothetical protein
LKADVAQLVEQSIRNRQVIGSSPIVGSIALCRFAANRFRFFSIPAEFRTCCTPLAAWSGSRLFQLASPAKSRKTSVAPVQRVTDHAPWSSSLLLAAHASRHSLLLPFPLLHGKSHFGDDRWNGHIRTGCCHCNNVSTGRRDDRRRWRWRCAAASAASRES